MDYVSTRNKERKVSAAYAIANGIAPDGGLYCPDRVSRAYRRGLENACGERLQGPLGAHSRQVPDRLHGGGAGGLCVQGLRR